MSKEKTKREKEKSNIATNSIEQDLIKILEGIDLKVKNRQVVQVLGENELVFEEEQFFLEETRNPKNRKKISRNAAKELLLDFAIKHNRNKKKNIIIKE